VTINNKSDTEYWLALKLVPRLATYKKIALVEQYGLRKLFSDHRIFSQLISANGLSVKQLSAFQQPNWQKVSHIINASKACQSHIINFNDVKYPQLLKQIYDPPLVLYVQGNSHLLNSPQLALVGSRSATKAACETAFILSKQLGQQHYVVTSGLALGIDAAAHQGALTERTGTIGVVANGLDQVYPVRHKKLAQQIMSSGGAIVSEFFPGVLPRPGHFPKRNRLISGLSLGVVVIEAEMKSGSLITARCALEQNREVFAIPSSILNTQAKGCHWLIKQGAKLVEQCSDITDEFDFTNQPSLHLINSLQVNQALILGVMPAEEKIIEKGLCNDVLLASVGFEVTPVDKLVSRSRLPVDEVLTRLTMLELSGLVSAVPGGYIRT